MQNIRILIARVLYKLKLKTKITLLDSRIHGTKYYSCKLLLQEQSISAGDRVILKREPDNPYDRFAIEVFCTNHKKIGYIPKKYSRIIAQIMDQGKQVDATIYRIAPKEYEPIYIKLTLIL